MNWTLEDYQEKDPKDLERIMSEDPKRIASLEAAYFADGQGNGKLTPQFTKIAKDKELMKRMKNEMLEEMSKEELEDYERNYPEEYKEIMKV